jgi:hypothetical protein
VVNGNGLAALPKTRRPVITARLPAELYANGCSVLAAVTFPDQVVL